MDEKCLSDLDSSLLTDWALISPGWVIFFAIDTSDRLLLNLPGAFLIIDVLLTSTPITAGFMAADPDHMIQALTLKAVSNLAVPVEEFNHMMYIA